MTAEVALGCRVELVERPVGQGQGSAFRDSTFLGQCAHAAGHALWMRVHLDTDFAGDTDDAAALVMLLGRPDAELLANSVDAGAAVICIGPCTNLAHLEATRPGTLAKTGVVLMGGWVTPPAVGLPPWGPEMDWNVQCDTTAALTVFETASDLTAADRTTPSLRRSRGAELVVGHAGAIGDLCCQLLVDDAHSSIYS